MSNNAAEPAGRRCTEPIAIVGISGRFPGGTNSLEALWNNLKGGIDMVGEWPRDRWDARFFHPDAGRSGTVYTKAGGFLDQLDQFDADFFGMSPREASRVDPQQRIVLELAWSALEDSGLAAKHLGGSKGGVFIGVSSPDYATLQAADLDSFNAYTNAGGALSIVANRVSFFLDLRGPSMSIDTACSSSLVAVHEACRSIWSGESEFALAGGVNVLVKPEPFVGFCKASMLARDGRCKSFDASGDGYVRAEGGVVLVLKPVSAAQRDHDRIWGLIVTTGVNSDGRTKGLALPNEEAQEALLRQVYSQAGIAPQDVFYIEAHGTGTSAGDPIECAAIGRVLGKPRPDESLCYVGSIKSNLGHLEPASGVAGIAKVLLALRHREIPPNLHFTTPNPKIPFEEYKLKVVTEPLPIPKGDRPCLIGVNSFGFGGTNAHVVIEEYDEARYGAGIAQSNGRGDDCESEPEQPQILLLSAHSPDALKAMASDYARFLQAPPAPSLPAICATAALRRSHFYQRLAVLGRSAEEVALRLDSFAAGEVPSALATGHAAPGKAAKTAFVFCGNGPQRWGMGRELYLMSPVFRETVRDVDAEFQPLAGWSIVKEMGIAPEGSHMSQTEVAQPMLFALQAGVVAILHEMGVRPAAAIGHSVGEIAAAYVAGALSLRDAVRVLFARSRLQGQTAGLGKMAAVGMSAEAIQPWLEQAGGWIEIAAINSPHALTLSGNPEALERLGAMLAPNSVFFRMLTLDYAFHSRVMDPIHGPLLSELHDLSPGSAQIPFISTVEGAPLRGTSLGAEYWWRNIREPVQFSSAARSLFDDGFGLFIEIGPHPVVRDYLNQVADAKGVDAAVITTLRRPAAGRPELELDAISTAICACYANGSGSPHAIFRLPRVPADLPPYPWQKQSYWSGPKPMVDGGAGISEPQHPLLGSRVAAAQPIWRATPDPDTLTYLGDHVVQGATVFPAAGFMEMAAAIAKLLHGDGPCELEDFDIRRPLIFAEKKSISVECIVDEDNGSFKISSRNDGANAGWTLLVAGKIGRAAHSEPAPVDLDALRSRLPVRVDQNTHYAAARARGLEYGPAFQGVERLLAGDAEVLGEIRMPASVRDEQNEYSIHPVVLDSCLQVLLGLVAAEGSRADAAEAYLPVQAAALRLYGKGSDVSACHVRIVRRTARSIIADFTLIASDGRVIGEIEHFRFQAIDFSHTAAIAMHADYWELDSSKPLGANCAPAPTPRPEEIARAVGPEIERICTAMDRPVFYSSVQPRLEELAGVYAAEALAALGARSGPFSAEQLAERGGVMPEYRRFLQRLIDMSRANGFVRGIEEEWQLATADEIPAGAALWRSLFRLYPSHSAETVLLGRCGQNLARIMRGEVSALKLIFGENASGTIEHLYDASPTFATYNRIAAAALSRICAAWPADRPMRVLEVGAGTGGLTASILETFPADRTSYTFTDVSEAFIRRAEHRFSRHRFMRFATLDIEQEPAGQGFAPGSFDLVIASDAIHVAGDLRLAVERVAALLAPDGLLLLLEKHAEDWVDVIFGTLTGWWNFTDHDLRPASALLSPQGWESVLAQAGFASVAALSDAAAVPVSEGLPIPQHSVLVARKNPASREESSAFSSARPRAILLLADQHGSGSDLAAAVKQELIAAGHQVVTAKLLDSPLDRNGEGQYAVVNDLPGLQGLLDGLRGEGFMPDEIVSLAGVTPADDLTLRGLLRLQDRKCVGVLNLIQALGPRNEAAPRLTLIAYSAHPGPFGSSPSDPAQSPVWGLGRVISNEHRELRCRLIDLHMPLEKEAAARLAEELEADDDETEVLLTSNRRYVMRVRATSASELASALPTQHSDTEDVYRLEIGHQGNIDSLAISQIRRIPPAPGQVEVRIHAAGLNFRDVMWAMGLLPEEALDGGFAGPTIGMECAGVIERVGSGVQRFAPGDRVIAFGSSCFGSHMVTDAAAVARIPVALSFEAGATIPTTFFTAYYSLEHLARLQPGERILIHGAVGGVGLAAIQLAQRRKAEIFATAGTEEKREILKMLGIGHVLDSRSLAFADEIMSRTDHAGVDVVLNSLAGEAIWKNLRILRPFGRFIELGKRDFYANSRIGLRPFRNNLTYYGVDLDQLLVERNAFAQKMLAELIDLFAIGELTPLPFRTFPLERASEAFRLLQQSRHIGKLVIRTETPRRQARPATNHNLPIRADATYLVTGGLTGFGLATAKWLVAKGARSLALVGRRGKATPEAEAGIAEMEASGATVRVFAADVADQAATAGVLKTIGQEMMPLRGLVHSAMVLDDAILQHLDAERFHRALDPKIAAAWLLHRLTINDPLDFFILYSSAAALVGNPGQGNYVSGCYYLEALADYRRALGLPALAVGWGAISDVGYIARNSAVQQLLESRAALKTITSQQALTALGNLMAVGAIRASVGFDLAKFRQLAPSASAPRFSPIFAGLEEGDSSANGSSDFIDGLKALPPNQRRQAMVRRLSHMLGRVMGVSGAQLQADRPLSELGIDSLMAVEFGGMVEDELGIKIPAMQALDGTMTETAQQFLEMLGIDGGGAEAGAEPGPINAADIEDMSEEQVDQLLEELTKESA